MRFLWLLGPTRTNKGSRVEFYGPVKSAPARRVGHELCLVVRHCGGLRNVHRSRSTLLPDEIGSTSGGRKKDKVWGSQQAVDLPPLQYQGARQNKAGSREAWYRLGQWKHS